MTPTTTAHPPAPASAASAEPAPLSVAAVALMKGVVYRDTHEQIWQHILTLQPRLRDHMDVLGLTVVIDEAEGYAFLRSKPEDPDAPIPRLVPRHRLSFSVSLLLALLRKALAEFDATSGEGRLVVTRERLVDDLRVFLADSTNEAKIVDQIDRTIAKAVELGFLRSVSGGSPAWEVRRILKAFVDAQWLGEFDARLRDYAAALAGEAPDGEPGGKA
ncbi:MAG: DUF4194 domain-containing protein [Tetrasphaera sp.]